MKIRAGRQSDREKILSFCIDTFSWGDYIDEVWDYWYRDKNGRLYIVEDDKGDSIAMSHVTLCPGGKTAWLQGVRVRPDYRRSKIATKLIERMLEHAAKVGAREASAIVAVENTASQSMMEKNGFAAVSQWSHYSTSGRVRKQKSNARIATSKDIEEIWQYLQSSEIFRLSAGRYVKAWHWYPLGRKVLQRLVRGRRVLVAGNGRVDGVAVVNGSGYWNRSNVLRIVYLDSQSANSLKHLVSFAANLYMEGKFEELQVICYSDKKMESAVQKSGLLKSEEFLLYNKVFTARAAPKK